MSDRELLELAAKAAGYTIRIEDDDDIYIRIGKKAYGFRWEYWNPRDDDGDALRLAVKLGDTFLVKVGICRQIDKAFCHIDDVATRENLGTDPLAAVRLAIVRAAAEIGRAMK